MIASLGILVQVVVFGNWQLGVYEMIRKKSEMQIEFKFVQMRAIGTRWITCIIFNSVDK